MSERARWCKYGKCLSKLWEWNRIGRDVRVSMHALPRPFQEICLYDSPSELWRRKQLTCKFNAWANQGGRKFKLKPVWQSSGIVCNRFHSLLFSSYGTVEDRYRYPPSRAVSRIQKPVFLLLLAHDGCSSSLILFYSIDWCLLELKILVMSKCSRPHNTPHTLTLVFVYNESDWISYREAFWNWIEEKGS